jgi:hypothetical protein
MTTRTRYTITCTCGHIGAINMSENDQPYSKSWESYTLENLNGVSDFSIEGCAKWEKVFEKLQPVCPKCNTALTPAHMA